MSKLKHWLAVLVVVALLFGCVAVTGSWLYTVITAEVPVKAQLDGFRDRYPSLYLANDPLRIKGADLRLTQQPGLDEYGWQDEQNGIARIPIDRAMEMIADSGP